MKLAASPSSAQVRAVNSATAGCFIHLAFTFVFAIAVITPTLSAQQQQTLHGRVQDPLGALIAGASVDLLRDEHAVASSKSGTDGTFQFAIPAPGRYRVRVAAASFEPITTSAVYVNGSGTPDLDITLATQTLTQQVTVTASGTPMPEAQTGASVTVLPLDDYRYMPEVQTPLRLSPGLQVTQTGQMGGTSSLSIRGGSTDANKVLIDGVPVNAIGGGVEFANIASVGIDSIEVLREPNSALYGSDALAGVVSMRSTRGSTPLPMFTYSGDAGNFHTYRNEVTAGTVFHQFDLYSAFARIDTDNNLPNSEFHNATYAGNFGWTPNPINDLRFTVRHTAVSGGQPNAIALYGVPDDSKQQEQDNYYSAVWNGQTTQRWHNQIRYGGTRQNGEYLDPAAAGIPDDFGNTDGVLVTIKGANGYSVTGHALFYTPYSPVPSTYLETTHRNFVYSQTDFSVSPHLLVLGGFKFENESGLNGYAGNLYGMPSSIQRGNYSYTIQTSGEFQSRLFYNLGTGLEDNGLFGFADTPRVSLAYYLARPSSGIFFSGTKLHGTFGKGIKEPSIFQQADSLYGTLAPLPNGSQLIEQYHVMPVGAENSRTYDGGLDQEILRGRARLGITYFHDEFTNGVEYVSQAGLLELGIHAGNLPAFAGGGAYINSLAFRSEGLEFESEYRIGNHLFARAGYTYTDARVQHSLDSDNLGCAPPSNISGCTFNSAFNFSDIPIGADSPLVGARPFRVAPHTGYFGLNYSRSKAYVSFTGTLVSKRDDSDFLTDSNFGNSLLLPNRNLLGSYERLELGGGYQVTSRLNIYANAQNLLSEHYYEAFGFPSLPMTFQTGIKVNFGGENWKLN
ncbi:TonB-dependent receptor plug domain-containing protein [Granulicella sp. 5B5]|uniref:TonB-dependent receptor n=1 Tax=Granulicella sp. 5B5 TaxID=1617967 RepID=UPI0015F43F76|nr:TonB-dependent receptor [Granulicella sp. 5B5]QMV17321.1 TonB-dependent receptor plug domain-containing protein [Granulicella sp. 5B5]